jgi:hypothetical protein
LIFVASPLGTQHQGVKAKTRWLGTRMSTHIPLFQLFSTIKIQLSMLV